jgi:dUTP diphosphatase
VILRVRRLDPVAVLPRRAHPGDAGYDLCALEPLTLAPGERAMVRTGVAIPEAPFELAAGDRIAQLVIAAVAAPDVEEIEELAASARGEGGFGSTGR